MSAAKHSGLFGIVLPSDGSIVDGYISGLRDANGGFLAALLRDSSYFTRFQLFTGDGDLTSRQKFWDQWLVQHQLHVEKQITVLPLDYLPVSFASDHYSLFFSGDPYLGYLLELRQAFSSRHFPIVGRAHALSQDISLGAWRSLVHGKSFSGDALLCSSEKSKQVVNNLLGEAGTRSGEQFAGQLIKLPLGVDEVTPDEQGKTRARQILGLPEEGIIILCLERLSPVDKADLHPLLQAYAELYDRYGQDHCYLYICGQAADDDDYVLSLVRYAGQLGIESSVFFNFDLPAEQKALAFSAADIFVSVADSVQESFGLAPVEAMSAGLPVVLSDWGDYRELIEDGQQGFLVSTCWGDVDGLSAPAAFFDAAKASLIQAQSVAINIQNLAEALYKLVESPVLRSTMGINGCRHFQENYQWKGVVRKFDDIAAQLKSLCQGERTSSGYLHSLHFHRIFTRYATRNLSRQAIIKTTLAGRQALSGQSIPASFNALDMTLPTQFLPELLQLCIYGVSLGDAQQQSGLARAQTDILVLWSLKHGLLQEVNEPVSSKAVLLERYKRRKSLASAQSLKRLLLRVKLLKSRSFSLTDDNRIVSVTPLSDKGYSGVVSILFHHGIRLVYRSVDMRMAQELHHKNGLLNVINSWCDKPVFYTEAPIMIGCDRFGSFGFRRYISGEKAAPSVDMFQLGMFSAFSLLSGMSDLHQDNFIYRDGLIYLLDSEMTCRRDVVGRLYQELCTGQLPESWQTSSLALTRIELFWKELLVQGWMPDKEAVEQIISGFQKGCELVTSHSKAWVSSMNKLADCPCRYDPVPFNSALPVLEQLENVDIHSVASLKELKQELLSQARRVLRQTEFDGGIQEEAVKQMKSWITGQHRSEFLAPENVKAQIKSIGATLRQSQVQVSFTWLSVLYQEWLEERFGLDW